MKEQNSNNFSRRDFIWKTAFAGTGLIIGSSALLNACTRRDGEKEATTAKNVKETGSVGKRKLGSLEVFPIGMGCMNAAWGFNKPMAQADAVKLFRQAADDGQNFFDTAEAYGAWLSEEMVGEALQPIRKNVIIASKFGFIIDKQGNIAGLDSRPESIRKAVEGSLKRLKTDYIDLLHQHRVDPKVPIEDVAGTVQQLIKEGKVREFGLSGVGAATIYRAHAVQPVASVQNEYSVWTRDPEGEILAACEELGIGLMSWSPLGKGYLTGTVKPNMTFQESDRRSTMPRFTPEAMKANWPIVELLEKVGKRHNATPGQINLAWLLARKPFIIPIPGTTNREHQKENMKAADVKLTDADMQEINTGLASIKIVGERAAQGVLDLLDIGNRGIESSKGTNGLSPLPAGKK